MGRSSGIVLLWHDNVVVVTNVRQSSQELHAIVKVSHHTTPWLLSVIYANTNYNYRNWLWDELGNISTQFNGPWFACGDFNEILTQEEKWGGRPINITRTNRFHVCINQCGLIDLGFKGPKYTWSNMRRNNRLIMQRLDRGLANRSWITSYPKANIVGFSPFFKVQQ